MKPPLTGQRGFALLITLTLLAFLLVLFVGLATYTRIETAIAGTTQRRAQARQNALVALDLAVAQLQRHTGKDERATASAEHFDPIAGTRHYTGVWDATSSGRTEMTWLVSGNEIEPSAVVPEALPPQTVELVGATTSGVAHDVLAPLVEITSRAVPGSNRETVIGRYAWWVGDQGQKAAVAVPERASEVAYAPFDSAELRSRLRQQTSRGAGPLEFEPRDSASAPRVRALTAVNQIALLTSSANVPLGESALRPRFHAWSANNFAVLANTAAGGLRRDLSLHPAALGDAFARWADWRAHVENPTAPSAPAPEPPLGPDPLRRRHRIVPPTNDGAITFTTAPVLGVFFLQFNVRRIGGNNASASTRDLEVRARMVCQLWNPWTAALVPEDLRLEVSGLPTVNVVDSRGGDQSLDLQQLFGAPKMSITLTATDAAFPGDPDDRSWLPGRSYYWRTKGGVPGAWATEFYNRTLAVANANVWTVPAGLAYFPPAANGVTLRVIGPATQLTIELRRAQDNALLSTVTTPQFEAFATDPRPVSSNDEYRFGFPIRLLDPIDMIAAEKGEGWLTVAGADPRSIELSDALYRSLGAGIRPEQYIGDSGSSKFSDENRLLDRVMGTSGMSYNEDVPVFELPRGPVLSVGQLQHLQLANARPFAIGNAWGATVPVGGAPANALFDRYFFSGLAAGVSVPDLADGAPLPNSLLVTASRKADGTRLTADDLAGAGPTAGFSSRFLLQGGAFNVNSTNRDAWVAVLRGTRFANEPFRFLEATPRTGTAGDDAVEEAALPGAVFFRFPQSAQETYKAEAGYAASTAVPPAPPTIPSHANTHLFRRGVRVLDDEQVAALADAIVAHIAAIHRTTGPFRSIEEFLAPAASLGGRNVLEQSIADAQLNAGIAEFSSQWLTSADIMSALAPLLFVRSDTFLVRAYGEAVNPATGAAEGRAWCEAVVQRTPEYFDAADAPEVIPFALTSELNQRYGRRFKIVSFRWLTRSDI